MRRPLVLAALLVVPAAAPLAAEPPHPGVYFHVSETAWWRQCFAVDQEAALRAVRENAIELPSFARDVRAVPAGENIELSFSYGGVVRRHTLIPCPFAREDAGRELACEAEVRTPRESVHLDGYYGAIEDKWGLPLVDCREGTARVVTHSFPVVTTEAERKMAAFLAERGLPIETATAGGTVREDRGRPPQDWSADFGFSLIQGSGLFRPEVCDAGVEQLSAEGREEWAGKYWCPWSLELVSLRCPGLPEVRGPAPRRLPVDAETLRPWCALRRRRAAPASPLPPAAFTWPR